MSTDEEAGSREEEAGSREQGARTLPPRSVLPASPRSPLPAPRSPTRKWLHGLIGGFVGGAAGAIDSGLALLVMAPDKFNFGPGLKTTLITTGILGVLSGLKVAFAYLKQSPLPPEAEG